MNSPGTRHLTHFYTSKRNGRTLWAGWIFAFVIGATLAALSQAHAEPARDTRGQDALQEQTLKQKALDPTSDLMQLQVKNRFIPSTFDADGYSNILRIDALVPIRPSRAVPIGSIWRTAFPIITAPGGPTGLSDIRFHGLFLSDKRYVGKQKQLWWRAGLGPVFVFPTATVERLGLGKWRVGPIVGGILSSSKWQLTLLIQNPISFAGDSDRPDTNRLIWQLGFVYWLPKEWYLALQGTPKTINWKNDNAATIPVSIRIGKVTQFIGRWKVNTFVEPEYTVVHEETPVPEWSIQLGFNFLFPLD